MMTEIIGESLRPTGHTISNGNLCISIKLDYNDKHVRIIWQIWSWYLLYRYERQLLFMLVTDCALNTQAIQKYENNWTESEHPIYKLHAYRLYESIWNVTTSFTIQLRQVYKDTL